MACDSPYRTKAKFGLKVVHVPCGRCPQCRHRRINDWIFRLQEEDKVSSSSLFITLTYNNNTVPLSENNFMTLKKKDFQDFMKRLRKLCPEKLRYYACGEYGSETWRPHYHAIIFNVPDPEFIEKAWTVNKELIGEIHWGNVTRQSIAYTCKYIDKSAKVPRHSRDDRQKEFSLMSKGLGESYLTDAKIAWHKADITRIWTYRDGNQVSLPRYYRERIYTSQERAWQVQHVIKQMEEKHGELAELVDKREGISMEEFDIKRKDALFKKDLYKSTNRKL